MALATVSVLVAGAAALLVIASQTVRAARLSTTAALLALQKVEQFEASPASLPAGTMQDYFRADGTPSPAASAVLIRRWTITPSWMSTPNPSVTVEVFAQGAGRLADVHAVLAAAGGVTP